MAYGKPVATLTLEASGDLSASQFRGMKVSAAQTVSAVAASTDTAIGVLINKPSAATRAAEIVTHGTVRCEAGAAVTAGVPVMFDTVGRVITATSTNKVHGIALQSAGAAGDLISVYFDHLGTF